MNGSMVTLLGQIIAYELGAENSVDVDLANTNPETRTPADVRVDKVYFTQSNELAERLDEES